MAAKNKAGVLMILTTAWLISLLYLIDKLEGLNALGVFFGGAVLLIWIFKSKNSN
jgi:hypothetical protein